MRTKAVHNLVCCNETMSTINVLCDFNVYSASMFLLNFLKAMLYHCKVIKMEFLLKIKRYILLFQKNIMLFGYSQEGRLQKNRTVSSENSVICFPVFYSHRFSGTTGHLIHSAAYCLFLYLYRSNEGRKLLLFSFLNFCFISVVFLHISHITNFYTLLILVIHFQM